MSKTTRIEVFKTTLYDPIRGFIYCTELFEKDLYQQRLNENHKRDVVTIFQRSNLSQNTSTQF
ncbi:hypothetical protein HYY75_06470 [bacterium]|nr:hypothetical protein [bacterium]